MPKSHPDIWRVEVVVPLYAVETFEAALEGFTDAVSWFLADPDADETAEHELWRLEGYSRTPLSRGRLETSLALAAAGMGIEMPAYAMEKVPDVDWVMATLRSFEPITIGRFFIHGSHYEGKVPAGKIGLLIDAGTAFGSGEHPTTHGCLAAIDRLLRRRRFRKPLDLGCGSGILGIAVAKAAAVPVLLSDIDPISVRVATLNAKTNGAAARIAAVVSDGYTSRAIRRRQPFDLIVANILARPLAHMAADLRRHLAPDGVAVLSGLLNRQERYVLAAHRAQGLSLLGRVRLHGWSTLILGRTPRGRL